MSDNMDDQFAYEDAEIVGSETALAVVKNNGGEIARREDAPPRAIPKLEEEIHAEPFSGEAQAVFDKYVIVPDDWVDIKPDDGSIYMTHMRYRWVLNQALGHGSWVIVPNGDYTVEESGNAITLYREYKLFIHGRLFSRAIGSGTYWKNNPAQNYSDAAETALSNALVRLCKPLGIAAQCWDKRYADWFKKTYCRQVRNGKGKLVWERHKWVEAWQPPNGVPTNLVETASAQHNEPKASPTFTGMVKLIEEKDIKGRAWLITVTAGEDKTFVTRDESLATWLQVDDEIEVTYLDKSPFLVIEHVRSLENASELAE